MELEPRPVRHSYSRWSEKGSAMFPTNFLCGPSSSTSAWSGCWRFYRGAHVDLDHSDRGEKRMGPTTKKTHCKSLEDRSSKGSRPLWLVIQSPKEPGLDISPYRLNWKQWCFFGKIPGQEIGTGKKHCIPKISSTHEETENHQEITCH